MSRVSTSAISVFRPKPCKHPKQQTPQAQHTHTKLAICQRLLIKALERFLRGVVLWRWLFATLERVNVGACLALSHGLQIGWRYLAH